MMRQRMACVVAVAGLAVMWLAGGMAYAGPYDTAVMADSPFLYYRFEEGGGPTAIDTAGGDQNGTYLGGVTLGQPSATPGLGSSGLFAGTDDRIDLPALSSYSQHSIEMWINTNGLAGGCCTSLYSTDTWGSGSLHYNIKSGRDIEHALNGGNPANVNTPGGVIQDGNWYHLVATYDATANGNVEIYIDGANQNVGSHNTTTQINLTTGGEIGTWGLGRDFIGNIDEVAMYASVLSEARVLAHYEAASEPDRIPEPATMCLLGLGLAALVRRRRKNQ
ncbi:LamG domain-containing protein [Planctomycetota bacterium]